MKRKIQPSHYIKIANELKKGTPRQQIIRKLSRKYGLTPALVEKTLTQSFSKRAVKSGVPVKSLLRQAIAAVKSPEDIRRNIRASRGPEKERATAALMRAALEKPEVRVAVRRKKLAWWAALAPEEKKRRLGKLRKGYAKMTETGRASISRNIKAAWARMTPEQRSEIAFRREASISPEEKLERSENISKALKAHFRKKLLGDVEHVAELPRLNVASAEERTRLFIENRRIVDSIVKRYEYTRRDFGDIRGVADLALAEAIAKWDRKSNLGRLIRDQVKYSLIEYFVWQKRIRRKEIQIGNFEAFLERYVPKGRN